MPRGARGQRPEGAQRADPLNGRAPKQLVVVKHIIENDMLNGEVIRLDGAIWLAPK